MSIFSKNLKKPPLWVLVLVLGLLRLADTSSLVALPNISQDFSVSPDVAQLSVTVFFAAICMMLLFWGRLIDRYGRRPCYLVAVGIFLFGSLLCLFSWNFEAFFIGRFFQGIGSSNASILVQTMIRDTFTKDERPKAYSTLGMMIPVSPAIGPILGGAINEFFHWRGIFLAILVINGTFAAYYFLRVAETKQAHGSTAEIKTSMMARLLLKDPLFLGSALLMGVVLSASAVTASEGSFLFTRVFALTPGEYGLCAGFMAISFGFGGFFSRGLLKAGQSSKQVMALAIKSLFSLGVFYVILAGLGLTAPSYGCFGFWLNLGLISSFTFFAGTLGPNTFSLVSDVHPKSGGTVSSIFTFIYFMCGAFFSFVVSIAPTGTPYTMPIVLLAIALFASTAYGTLVRKSSE